VLCFTLKIIFTSYPCSFWDINLTIGC
jgi:hypothetical protein